MSDAVLLDFGNVLVDVDFRRALAAWSRASGVPAATLARRFRMDEAYCAHERGEIDDAAYFASLRRALGIGLSGEEMLMGWNAIFGEPLPGIEETLRVLAQRWPLYVFSNTNPAHLAHFRPRYRALLSRVDKVFASCELGRRKPDPAAFVHVAALAGVAPARLAFFDDLEENVAGARRAGLRAHRVERPGEILELLLEDADG